MTSFDVSGVEYSDTATPESINSSSVHQHVTDSLFHASERTVIEG